MMNRPSKQASHNVSTRLKILESLPKITDISGLLGEVHKNPGKIFHLPWVVDSKGLLYDLACCVTPGQMDPEWTLSAGSVQGGLSTNTLWSHASPDMDLILNLCLMECEDASTAPADKDAQTSLSELKALVSEDIAKQKKDSYGGGRSSGPAPPSYPRPAAANPANPIVASQPAVGSPAIAQPPIAPPGPSPVGLSPAPGASAPGLGAPVQTGAPAQSWEAPQSGAPPQSWEASQSAAPVQTDAPQGWDVPQFAAPVQTGAPAQSWEPPPTDMPAQGGSAAPAWEAPQAEAPVQPTQPTPIGQPVSGQPMPGGPAPQVAAAVNLPPVLPTKTREDSMIGRLAETPSNSLLQSISLGLMTGLLRVHEQNTNLDLWFEQGALVHATSREGDGEAAVLELLLLTKGDFEFLPNDRTTERSVTRRIDNVVLDCMTLVHNYQYLEKNGLTVNSYLIRRNLSLTELEFDNQTKNIHCPNREMLKMLYQQIDQHSTFLEMQRKFPSSKMDWLPALYTLVTGNLVEISDRPQQDGKPVDLASVGIDIRGVQAAYESLLRPDTGIMSFHLLLTFHLDGFRHRQKYKLWIATSR
jgi:hypothetical protein